MMSAKKMSRMSVLFLEAEPSHRTLLRPRKKRHVHTDWTAGHDTTVFQQCSEMKLRIEAEVSAFGIRHPALPVIGKAALE